MTDDSQQNRANRINHLPIAISYRRADSAEVSAQIYRRLCLEYGREDILFDIESIPIGVDFRRYIDQTLRIANVVLAVIGNRWMGDSESPRINDETDFVRLELEAALRRNITIVPIFVDGAKLSANDLPMSLRELPFRNGITIASTDLEAGIDQLVRKLDELVSSIGSPYVPAKPAAFYGDSQDSYSLAYIDQDRFETTRPRDKPVAAILSNRADGDLMLLIAGQPVVSESTYYIMRHPSLTNAGSARVMLLAFTLDRPWRPWWRWTRNRLDIKACDVRMTVDSSDSNFKCNIIATRLSGWRRFIEIATDDTVSIETVCYHLLRGTDSLVTFKFIDLNETASFHFGRIRQAKAIEEVLSF
jgi:hypothetical protein